MTVVKKTKQNIEKMRQAGAIAAHLLSELDSMIRPGITTEDINHYCHQYIIRQDAIPAPLNYKGFPKSVCTSVNHVICHGIPSASQLLKEGDIINVDVTVIKDGYHGDTSKMYYVGRTIAPFAKRLVETTQTSLWRAIQTVKPGTPFFAIGKAIQEHAEACGYFVVRDFCGHGIGTVFHEDPQVLHYYDDEFPASKLLMEEGMVFTIEPMINESSAPKKVISSKLLQDGWTAITADKQFEKTFGRKALSAQWEHTIAVTATGCEVLTVRDEEAGYLATL